MDCVDTRTPETSVREFKGPGENGPRYRFGRTSRTRPRCVGAVVIMKQIIIAVLLILEIIYKYMGRFKGLC